MYNISKYIHSYVCMCVNYTYMYVHNYLNHRYKTFHTHMQIHMCIHKVAIILHHIMYLGKLLDEYIFHCILLVHQDRNNLQHIRHDNLMFQYYHMFEDTMDHTADIPSLVDTQQLNVYNRIRYGMIYYER